MIISIKLLLVLLVFSFGVCNQEYFAPQLIALSKIAYQSSKTLLTWSCPQCQQNPVKSQKVFSAFGLQGFAAYSTALQSIVLSFRGTNGILDIINIVRDLDEKQVDYPHCKGCLVHHGIYSSWNLLKDDVLKNLHELTNSFSGAGIYVTGHSLGGAIAVLASRDIVETFRVLKFHKVVTFGQPRVGNPKFAEYMNAYVAKTYRVVHNADIIPHNPSLDKFKHHGLQLWYNEEMILIKTCSEDIDGQCSNSLKTFRYSIKDHSLDKYRFIANNQSAINRGGKRS